MIKISSFFFSNNTLKLFLSLAIISLSNFSFAAGEKISYPQLNWSFSGILGTFDRASQQRGASSLQRGMLRMSWYETFSI